MVVKFLLALQIHCCANIPKEMFEHSFNIYTHMFAILQI